jgi:hypothetical protein
LAEIHDLNLSIPSAPSVSASNGGSLTDATDYYVLVTFYEESTGRESLAGVSSAVVTTASPNLTISITSIPLSGDTLVTSRRLYLRSGTGNFYFSKEISDNTTTTSTITSNATSLIRPPDYNSIRKLHLNPFFESSNESTLIFRDAGQLRLLFQGQFETGTPSYWAPISDSSVLLYPRPSSSIELSFNFYRYPKKVYYSADSQPELPIVFKQAIKAGVIAMGYEYRDRSGHEGKRQLYESILSDIISRNVISANSNARINDVIGNTDGFEVSN